MRRRNATASGSDADRRYLRAVNNNGGEKVEQEKHRQKAGPDCDRTDGDQFFYIWTHLSVAGGSGGDHVNRVRQCAHARTSGKDKG